MARKRDIDYCIVRNNSSLKRFVKREIDRLGLSYADLVEETGIDIRKISNYLDESKNVGRKITQLEALCLASFLGYSVELKIQKSNVRHNAKGSELSSKERASI